MSLFWAILSPFKGYRTHQKWSNWSNFWFVVSYYDVQEPYWANLENFDFSPIFSPRIAENSMYGAKFAQNGPNAGNICIY